MTGFLQNGDGMINTVSQKVLTKFETCDILGSNIRREREGYSSAMVTILLSLARARAQRRERESHRGEEVFYNNKWVCRKKHAHPNRGTLEGEYFPRGPQSTLIMITSKGVDKLREMWYS
jgi:hypothetical protein